MLDNNNSSLSFVPVVCIVFLTLIFGGSSVATKIILNETEPYSIFDIMIIASLRFAIASVAIVFWAVATKRSFLVKSKDIRPVSIISICFTFQIFFFYIGVNQTYASRGALISGLLPFPVMVLSKYFLKEEKFTSKKVLGCCIAFVGTMILFSEGIGLSRNFLFGDIFVFMGVLSWACVAVYTKKIINNYDPFHLVLYPMICLSLFFVLIGLLYNTEMSIKITFLAIVATLYQGIIGTAFGFVAWNTFLSRYGASTLHSFIFLPPVFAVILSSIILKEPVSSNIFASLIFVVIGLMLVNWKSIHEI